MSLPEDDADYAPDTSPAEAATYLRGELPERRDDRIITPAGFNPETLIAYSETDGQ